MKNKHGISKKYISVSILINRSFIDILHTYTNDKQSSISILRRSTAFIWNMNYFNIIM